jgi:hypothetical protein
MGGVLPAQATGLLAALVVSWCLPGKALAASPVPVRPRVAAVVEVVPGGGQPSPGSEASAPYYAALLAAGFPPVDERDRDGLTGPLQPVVLTPDAARAALLEARGHFKRMDLELARGSAERGIALLLETPRLADNLPLLGSLHLLLAEVALAEGRDAEASTHLDLCLRVDPGRELHPGLYPPPVVKAHGARRVAVDSVTADQGRLSVVAHPADARVLVDGAPWDAASAGGGVLPAGDHYVVATTPGGAARGQRVTVPPGGLATLQLFVPPPGGARDRAAARLLPLREAASSVLDLVPAAVVLAHGSPGGEVAMAMAGAADVVVVPAGLPSEQVARGLELLATASTGALPLPATQDTVQAEPPPRLPEPAPPPESPSWLPAWVGLALGTAGGGAVLLALAGSLAVAVGTPVAAGVGYLVWMNTRPTPSGHARGRVVLGGGAR